MTVNYKKIGQRIKEIRCQNHMTQAELAERAHISDNYISRVERGVKKVSLGVLIKIAKVLDTPLDALVFVDETEQ